MATQSFRPITLRTVIKSFLAEDSRCRASQSERSKAVGRGRTAKYATYLKKINKLKYCKVKQSVV